MPEPESYFRKNNLDLLRLIAACQVLVTHGAEHLNVHVSPFWGFIYYFPGVPVFFFISGFLISASWERHSDIRNFAINRVLRIYPALWLVFFYSLLLVLMFDRSANLNSHIGGIVVWGIAHLTILQVWNPPLLRSFGMGSINGSLWTIPVELSFYIATPLIYWVGKRVRSLDTTLILIIVLSFALQYALTDMEQADRGNFAVKLLLATPLPWIGMFCVGVMAQRHIAVLYPLVAGRLWIFFGIYVLAALIAAHVNYYPVFRATLNSVGITNFAAMIGLILSFGYSYRGLADRILRRNDISYGIYIFHMPTINALIALGVVEFVGLEWAIGVTILCAIMSWVTVERPALALRPKALYRHGSDAIGNSSYAN